MRDEFERNRYWVGLFRTDVEFDEGLGEFGRYVSSGARKVDTGDLETFNERWEAYANAWSFQQKKLDDLKQIVDAWELVESCGGYNEAKKEAEMLEWSNQADWYNKLIKAINLVEQSQ
jgi:hypothetical protein